LALTKEHSIELAVFVDPASALVDSTLIEAGIEQALALEDQPIVFSPATPGACAPVLRDSFIATLEKAAAHPGMILTYRPDRPILDPTGSSACQRVSPRVSRTKFNLLAESERTIKRLERLFSSGDLDTIDAESAIDRLELNSEIDDFPRDVTLELNTDRLSAPIDQPTNIQRDPITLAQAESLLSELGNVDDARLTLAGLGDPMLHPQFAEIVRLARKVGVRAICVETDLLTDESSIKQLVELGIDVVSIRIPATSKHVYQQMMGVDGFSTMLNNVRTLVTQRGARGSMLPLAVPVFVKTRENFHEMELWYDQWITALGSAHIRGPSDFGGLIDDISVADMRPSCRSNCSRLSKRISVLCDGRIVPCEEDVLGRQAIGTIGQTTLASAWKSMNGLRTEHREGSVTHLPVCGPCKQWHRP
ncbi:MAG TPA: radical SAM protein, partial [Tepidisphaeraceae bacterium]|nr:radical SAM protein [Tepidisphaeraceae bacterium]